MTIPASIEAIDRRRELTRERVRRHRARLAAGRRCLACDVEIAPGLSVRRLELDEVEAEDMLVAAGILRPIDCDSSALVDEGVRLFLLALRKRYDGAG